MFGLEFLPNLSNMQISLVAFILLFVMLAIRIPIGVSMLAIGILGYAAVVGWTPTLNQIKNIAYDTFSNYTFSIVPLFLLMGEFATFGGVSQSLFKSANTWLGHRSA